MSNYLITGASGFIGKQLTKTLLNNGHLITGVSRSNPNIEHENFTSVQEDLKNWEKINLSSDFDGLIHLAWAGSMGDERFNTEIQLQNIENTVNAVKLASKLNVKKFIGIGTITEDEIPLTTITSENPPGPGYFYGLAKTTAKQMSHFTAAHNNIEHVWVKLGNTYGPNDPTKRFLTFITHKIIANEPVLLTAGTQLYDFVHIDDVTTGLQEILKHGKPNSTYYLGSNNPLPLKEFVKKVHEMTNSDSKLEFGGTAFTGVKLHADSFNMDNLINDTGFTPNVSFTLGMKTIIQEIQEKQK